MERCFAAGELVITIHPIRQFLPTPLLGVALFPEHTLKLLH